LGSYRLNTDREYLWNGSSKQKTAEEGRQRREEKGGEFVLCPEKKKRKLRAYGNNKYNSEFQIWNVRG